MSTHWHQQGEQSAGRLRILALWYCYRFLGRQFVNALLWIIFPFIYPWCKPARAALKEYYQVAGVKPRPFRHLLNFAQSMMDKTDACTLRKNPPKIEVVGDKEWMKGGCFLVSTHIGCIECLPYLLGTNDELRITNGGKLPLVNAFQQMGHDAVFTQVFKEHLGEMFKLHAVEDIGVETAVMMQDEIKRGNIVLMAGDRASANSQTRKLSNSQTLFGKPVAFPKGVFSFARLMECPVYAITCVKTGINAYEVHTAKLGGKLVEDYARFLETEASHYPYQWYHFYSYFGYDFA